MSTRWHCFVYFYASLKVARSSCLSLLSYLFSPLFSPSVLQHKLTSNLTLQRPALWAALILLLSELNKKEKETSFTDFGLSFLFVIQLFANLRAFLFSINQRLFSCWLNRSHLVTRLFGKFLDFLSSPNFFVTLKSL